LACPRVVFKRLRRRFHWTKEFFIFNQLFFNCRGGEVVRQV